MINTNFMLKCKDNLNVKTIGSTMVIECKLPTKITIIDNGELRPDLETYEPNKNNKYYLISFHEKVNLDSNIIDIKTLKPYSRYNLYKRTKTDKQDGNLDDTRDIIPSDEKLASIMLVNGLESYYINYLKENNIMSDDGKTELIKEKLDAHNEDRSKCSNHITLDEVFDYMSCKPKDESTHTINIENFMRYVSQQTNPTYVNAAGKLRPSKDNTHFLKWLDFLSHTKSMANNDIKDESLTTNIYYPNRYNYFSLDCVPYHQQFINTGDYKNNALYQFLSYCVLENMELLHKIRKSIKSSTYGTYNTNLLELLNDDFLSMLKQRLERDHDTNKSFINSKLVNAGYKLFIIEYISLKIWGSS